MLVVFLPGWNGYCEGTPSCPGPADFMETLLPQLGEATPLCVQYPPEGAGSFSSLATHVWQVVAATAAATAETAFLLVGYSMGGFVLQAMLEAEEARALPAWLAAVFISTGKPSVRGATRFFPDDLPKEPARPFWKFMNGHLPLRSWEYHMRTLQAVVAMAVTGSLSRPAFAPPPPPCLVIHGGCDDVMGVELAEELAGALSAQLHKLSGAGHALLDEDPKTVAHLVARWVKGLPV